MFLLEAKLARLLRLTQTLFHRLSIFLSLGVAVAAIAQSPEHPAITRSVTGIQDGEFDRPALPAIKTSADGRIGLSAKQHDGSRNFFLIEPEELSAHFSDSPKGSPVTDNSLRYDVESDRFFDGVGTLRHVGLWDPSERPGATVTNPYTLDGDGKDYYDLFVIAGGGNHYDLRIWKTPICVIVADPKTDGAYIEDIKFGTPESSPAFSARNFFEPQVSNDGKLIVARIQTDDYQWAFPAGGDLYSPRIIDIVYSYSSTGDVADWDAVLPIANAPYDSRINGQYGFAMHPFKDFEGNLIPPDYDLKATYPWLSRDASMISFTVLGTRLNEFGFTGGRIARYPNGPSYGSSSVIPAERAENTRGQTMLGLWTRGKMVLMDGVINKTDYGLEVDSPGHRDVSLYQPNSGPVGNEAGIIQVGSGRAASGQEWPELRIENTTFFDSLETSFSYDDNFKVRTPFDVVWRVSNGTVTEEFAFDDYTHNDGFIVTNMTGSLTYDTPAIDRSRMTYYDGWSRDTRSFSGPVRFANAASPDPARWAVPSAGEAFGSNMRLEPIAMGGIHGKGAWVDGSSGIKYAIAAQPQEVEDSDWYVSVFADCRFGDDGTDRLLFSFPDGTGVYLRGLSHVVYRDVSGSEAAIINLPALLPEKAWSHLAIQVLNGGYEIEFYLNGVLYHRWTNPIQNLFQMVPGELSLAKIEGGAENGFRGWLDSFKVFADSMNPENAANHAGGTLVGFDSDYHGPLESKASLYPDWVHEELSAFLANQGEPTFDYYANWADYSDDGMAHLLNVPDDVDGLRHSFLFPEGPIFHDAPRPESRQNKFCLTCHSDTNLDGLSLAPLEVGIGDAASSFIRQPSQPPRLLGGNIPPNWIPGSPASGVDLGTDGVLLDQWLLPDLASHTLTAATFTLVDAATGTPLLEIEDGSTLDYGKLGSRNVNLVANIDSAQGSVVFGYDGDSSYQTDNSPPYELFASSGQGLLLGDLGAGSHTITATPYTMPGGGGIAGGAKTVTFTVVDLIATIEADSSGDFQSSSPQSGWEYLTNSLGPIGTEANYEAIPPSGANYVHPATDARRFRYGGLPGNGFNMDSLGIERYSISAFTVSLEGQYYLTDSLINQYDGTRGNGTQLLVMVGDTIIEDVNVPRGEQVIFDTNLGYLKPGDKVYVAVGAKGWRGGDTYALEFSLAHADLTVVADYLDDFQGVSPKRGWQYLWNANGPVGDEAGYVAMNWDGISRYDSDAVRGVDATQLNIGRFEIDGRARPGNAAGGGNAHDRCVIAAYSTTVAGDYVIADSVIDQRNASGDGVDVFVYVNDTLVHQILNGNGDTSEFDCSLGYLSLGDTIYVALGPRDYPWNDMVDLDFSILVDPE